MDLHAFFKQAGVEEFTEVSLTDLMADDQTYVREFFPSASSAIIFGRPVPPGAYQLSPADQTREMLAIAEYLNDVAIRLAELLRADGIPAEHIPLYLPVRIDGGRVQGVVRLKHLAAAGGLGTIGRNTLLLHPIHGPRLLLSGVVTGKTGLIEKSDDNLPEDGGMEAPIPSALCRRCGACIRACPVGAIGPDGVDTFRCRTISPWVPGPVVPIATWLIGRRLLLRCLAPVAPWIARMATIRCSRCVTECPVFGGRGG
ncbi:hypothetical protein RJ53_10710 [Methanocalculus chunghsingensis]|uniref:4Fe-4S ferredoxin-type domain-containing protein n=1 Tax=Methanocalculus chunghsingensis TaxID=156457 RepID=A0A8J7W8X8_9EURY|nr:hypothetical protein [Methanocalculus chunghsingensis]